MLQPVRTLPALLVCQLCLVLAGSSAEPETPALPNAEAEQVLVNDWLFQADHRPSFRRARQEIRWGRELAKRLAGHDRAPDLSRELLELDALEKRYADFRTDQKRPHLELPKGLAAYWSFECRDKRMKDTTGSGHDGAVTGLAERVPGLLGGGILLDGGGVLNVGTGLSPLASGNYTICAWIKTTSNEADIFGSGVGKGYLLFMTYRGVLRGHHWTSQSGNVIDGKTRVNDGEWHHVAEVVNRDSISLFVDGKLDATQSFKGKRTAPKVPLLIGSRSPQPVRSSFTGSLDEVYVFNRALAAKELAGLFSEADAKRRRTDPAGADFYLAVRRVKRRIMFKSPEVDFQQVLFIDIPYPKGGEWAHEARHRDGMMSVPDGRLLALDGLQPGGRLRQLAPLGRPASFWRADLSFDARKVLFCMKPAEEKSFHLYEINIDGTGLKQLTNSPYDDLDPIYLPDGKIMFSTTRGNTYVRCMPYTYCYVLARCDGDGRNLYIISQGNEPDWLPTLLDDGRIIYTRWEYTDKMLWRIQSLWTINPDGTNVSTFWGNQSIWPDMLIEARSIPGSRRVMFTGAAHHDWFAGSIGILDPRRGLNYPRGLTKVTREVPWPECGRPPVDPPERSSYHRSGPFKAYKTPFPLSEELFLVSARGGSENTYRGPGKFKLYLMDIYGNRELIYQGEHNILHAVPVRPRSVPVRRPDRVAWPGTGRQHQPVKPGVFFSPDVYEGVQGLPRGKAKFLRVIQMDARTYSTWHRDVMPHQHAGPTISILQSDGVKRILGTAPIYPDGSVHFEVPPGKALHFQLLDENYRALQTMRTFTGAMPGERRGCFGCHEAHTRAPSRTFGEALKHPPAKLDPPPWGTKTTLGYERMIQPILERACGECHTGQGKGRSKLDLTLRPGAGVFKEPYVTLVGGSVYFGKRRLDPPPSLAGCMPIESWPHAGVPQSVQTFPPMKYLSYASTLVNTYASGGSHYEVQMASKDLRILSAWIDLICPYRGEEEVRAIPDPNFPGIEKLPIRPRVKTAPDIDRFNLTQDAGMPLDLAGAK